jgi:hypothetical protein
MSRHLEITSRGICPEDHHLPLVRLAGQVTLETILVSTLFLAHLTVPSQLLQAFGFYAICNLQFAYQEERSNITLAGKEAKNRIFSSCVPP